MARPKGLPEFPFPFQETGSSWEETTGASAPLTRKERLICHVMQSVMRKPGWMKKYHFFVGKWKEELKQATIPKDLDPDASDREDDREDDRSSDRGDDAAELESAPEEEGTASDAPDDELDGKGAEEDEGARDTEEASKEDVSSKETSYDEDTSSDAVEGTTSSITQQADRADPKKKSGEPIEDAQAGDREHSDDVPSTAGRVPDDIIKYALSELKWLVDTHDGGPVEPSPVAGVFIIPDADRLLEPAGAKEVLLLSVSKMEDVPEDQVDYHPGTNNQVVDLVHPSLFCLSYGKTRVITGLDDEVILSWDKLIGSVGDQVAQLPDNFSAARCPEFISHKFQWLPAELDIPLKESDAARFRSYINNLNPREYPELYPALASIFNTCFVPLFNRVLTQLASPRQPRLEVDCYSWYDNWKGEREYNMEDDDDWCQWDSDKQPEQPKIPEFQPPPDVKEDKQVDLRGRRLQVIVKIAEIKLNPEDPDYPGGAWHVEGMKNESIVATGIYYFDSDNIKDSELLFRKAVDEPRYEQNDRKGMWKIFGLRDDSALVQSLGSVPTSAPGLCLAFPNLYHHKVSPFSLADPSKPGHRKILAFFLVDPGKRVVSTARVPPQQERWRRQELERSVHPCSVLPAPALERVIQDVCRTADAMGEEEAKDFRMHLMMERKMLLDEAKEEVLERPFSLCEH